MQDGSSCDGVVSARPSVQMFRDANAQEGINARVLLRRPDVPEWRRNIWLDQVVRVEHLDSTPAGASRIRRQLDAVFGLKPSSDHASLPTP